MRIDSPVLKQTQLLLACVLQHPDIPAVVARVDVGLPGPPPPCLTFTQHTGQPALSKPRSTAALDAVRCHGCSGVHSHPALAVLPELGPGVRVAVTHNILSVHRVELCALKARHHARRYAHGSHHHDIGRGKVLAKTGATIQPEAIDQVTLGEAIWTGGIIFGCQRVGKLFGANVSQQCL